MDALPIVEDFQVVKENGTCLLMRSEDVAFNTLSLHGSPNGLHQRIIPAIPFPTHADRDPAFCEASPVGTAGILTPTIGVMQQSFSRLTTTQCHVQSIGYQGFITGRTHRPTHDKARIAIDNASEIEPPLLCPDSGDIPHPFFIGLLGMKVPLEEIRSDWMGMVAIGCPGLVSLSRGDEATLAHQADHALATTAQTLLLQDGMDTRTPVNASPFLENPLDLLTQTPVFLLMARFPSPLPGVIATFCDLENPTGRTHRKLLLV
jgi:hypothetical protein